MAKFCTSCGSPLTEGVAFCTQCGAKAEAAPVPAPQPQSRPAPAPSPAPQIQPQPPVAPAPEPVSKPVSTLGFFGMMLLFALPVVGWLACILMAFLPRNKNIRSFARATLIWLLIGLILAGVVAAAVGTLVYSAKPYLEEITAEISGQMGTTGDLSELTGELGALAEMLEQIQATGETIPET